MEVQPEGKDKPSPLDRRLFLKLAIGGAASLVSLILAIPLVAAFVAPTMQTRPGRWTKVGSIEDVPIGQPVSVQFPDQERDTFIQQSVTRSIWLIKRSPNEVVAFSPICPHLGCYYNWDSSSKQFICPCHMSIYDGEGKVLGGPAPRPLDTLRTRIDSGQLWVEWVRYKVGLAQKVEG
jgi:Rieske Fe-S protein